MYCIHDVQMDRYDREIRVFQEVSCDTSVPSPKEVPRAWPVQVHVGGSSLSQNHYKSPGKDQGQRLGMQGQEKSCGCVRGGILTVSKEPEGSRRKWLTVMITGVVPLTCNPHTLLCMDYGRWVMGKGGQKGGGA